MSAPSLLDYALRYARQGIPVIPLYGISKGACVCGDAACRSPGKHPVNAHGAAAGSTDEAQIRAWFERYTLDERNIGLCTGLERFVVDVDVKHDGLAKWDDIVRKHAGGVLPDTWTAQSGGGGTHLWFRRPTGMQLAGIIERGIDIRQGNQLAAVEPSRHLSGGWYCWLDGQEPGEIALADAPTWLLTLLQQRQTQIKAAGAERIPDTEVARLRSALAYIDAEDRQTWLDVGMALDSTRAGQQAFGLWWEWSQTTPHKADLPDTKRVWKSLGKKEGITTGTIFMLARAAGWRDPFAEEGARIITLMQRPKLAPTTEEIAPAPKLPELEAGSNLHAIAKWMEQDAGLPPDAATFTAVALACACAARNYRTAARDDAPIQATHGAFIMAAGDDAVLTRGVIALQALYEAAGAGYTLEMQRIGHMTRLLRTLLRWPTLYLCTDLADMARVARRQSSGEMARVFTGIEAAHNLPLIRANGKDDLGAGTDRTLHGSKLIHAPALTLFAPVSPTELADIHVMQSSMRGLMELAHVWTCTERATVTDSIIVPPWARDFVRAVLRPAPEPEDMDGQLSHCCLHPPTTRLYVNFDLPESREFAIISGSDSSRARRVTSAIAAFEQPDRPAVTAAHVAFARDFVLAGRAAKESQRQCNASDEGKLSDATRVLADITSLGPQGATPSRIAAFSRRFRGMSAKARGELLDQMTDDGAIVSVQVPGKRKPVYIASALLKQDAKQDGVSSQPFEAQTKRQ